MATSAPLPAPAGGSETPYLRFRVEGEANWCRDMVKVSMTVKESAVLTENSERFQQILGGIRSAVQDDCPDVRSIMYFGSVGKELVAVGENSVLTNWKHVPLSIKGKRPPCKEGNDPQICEQRWQSFLTFRQIFLNGGLTAGTLTRYLAADAGSDIEFVQGEIKGKAAVITASTGVPFSSAAEFVANQTAEAQVLCEDNPVTSVLDEINTNAAAQSVSCTVKGKPLHAHYMIEQWGGDFHVIWFSDYTSTGQQGAEAAQAIRSALARIPVADGSLPCRLPAAALVPNTTTFQLKLKHGYKEGQTRVTFGLNDFSDDPWQLTLKKLSAADRNVLSGEGSVWLSYSIVDDARGRHFETQLWAARPGSYCLPMRNPLPTKTAQLPAAVAEHYADVLDLPASSAKEARKALAKWLQQP